MNNAFLQTGIFQNDSKSNISAKDINYNNQNAINADITQITQTQISKDSYKNQNNNMNLASVIA